MTPAAGWRGVPDDDPRPAAVRRLVAAWSVRSGVVAPAPAPGPGSGPEPAATPVPPVAADVRLVDVAVLRDGRPGLLDVVATVAGRPVHAVLGLRRPGDEVRVIGPAEDPVVGTLEDEHGPATVVDALCDADLARLLLVEVCGTEPGGAGTAPGGGVTRAARHAPDPSDVLAVVDDEPDVVLDFDERRSMRVFSWPHPWPHPGVAFLLALDEAGFNHLPPPVAVWRRDGRDLGIVQELFVGAAPGWAIALGSLRDVCASGCPPEEAGGDFAPEARALGTMVARMHLALDRAFGHRDSDLSTLAEESESAVARIDAAALHAPNVDEALAGLRRTRAWAPVLRVHGDLHLGRTARCDQGWVLADCMPGGTDPATGEARYRSPLADVADVLWSLGHAAAVAAADLGRDPLGHPGAEDLAVAWEARNRRAFLSGYLATAGIEALVTADRSLVRHLLALLELERDARLARRRHPAGERRPRS